MKKNFFYISFSIFASLKICLRLSSMLCSGNVCMMFNCRLYFICTSVAWNSTVRGSHSPLLIPMPAVLWVTTFLKKGMNELIKLSLQSILTSIHCLLILIAFSLLTLSGNLLPVLIFAFSSCCSYCFSKCRYHSFLLFWFYHSLIGNVWHDLTYDTSEDKHLFAHVLTICFASFVICLFLSFTEFYIGVYFCFFLVIFNISLRLNRSAFVCFLTH